MTTDSTRTRRARTMGLGSGVAIATLSTAALAQTPSLERITVTAEPLTPTAPGIDAAREEIERVAGGAGIVSRDDYAGGRAGTLLDMLGMTPGVFIQPRFGGEESRLSIRGSGLQRTFHLRGIYLLQDGVPLTLADGGGDFQTVEPMALAYTEVLRGANALRYGGTTLGGAINFVSPSGHDRAGLSSRIEGGSFGYRRAMLTWGDASTARDRFISISGFQQDGFRDWSRQQGLRLFGNAGFQLSERIDTRFYVSALQSDSQLPGSLTKAQLQEGPTAANAGNLAGRQQRNYDLYRIANRTVFQLTGGVVELSAGYSYKDLWHPIFQLLQQRSDDYSAGIRYVNNEKLAGRDNRLTVGVAPSLSRLEDDRFVNLAGQPGNRTGASLQTAENIAAYAENQWDIDTHWTLVTGAQWTRAKRRFADYFLVNGDQGFAASYTRLSPKLGFLWRGAAQWTVFGNLSGSFEPPSFGELSGGPGITQVDAQHARTLEIGTRGARAGWRWDLVGYSAQVSDELLSLNSPTGQPLGTVNAPRTVHRGIEAGLDMQLSPTLSWRSAYLWNEFRFDDNASYGDHRLPGIPQHLYRGELAWMSMKDCRIALNGEWSPRRYAIDMAQSWFADSYALWGVKVSRTMTQGLSWFIEGRNLSDKRYAATTGVIANANAADAAQFLPGEGRALFAGVSWTMKGER